MKALTTVFFSTLFFLTISAITCLAQEKAPLGIGNLVLKIDYIDFTDSSFIESDGIYVGLEGYYSLSNNWYLGGEFGQATNISLFIGEEIDFFPVEINAKYALSSGTDFVLDFGAGMSYNKTGLTSNYVDMGNEWLLGGQIFAGLTYKIGWFAIGLNGKYQTTEEFKDSGISLSNYRIGLSLGGMF